MQTFQTPDGQNNNLSWYQKWHQNPRHRVYHWIIFLIIIFLVFSLVMQSISLIGSQYFTGNVSYAPSNSTGQSNVPPNPPVLKTPATASFSTDHILVKFKPSQKPDDVFLKQNNLSSASKLITGKVALTGMDRLFIAKLPAQANIAEVLKGLNNNPNVEYAELDHIFNATMIPNDTNFTSQWPLNNTGQSGGTAGADIHAPLAWDVTTGTDKVTVAVIDTGVDYTHSDLAANIWANAGEIPDNGIDDDSNGFIDDVRGWNFVAGTNNPMDDNSHGTHVAGTIGAVGNNAVGVAGIDWNVKIMALKFLDATGSGATSNAIRALNYAVLMGAKVSNNSWGGASFNSALSDAITSARTAGHIFVAAAGNDGLNNDTTPFYPANYSPDNVISVAATDRYDALASFSNYGSTSVDLAAPGFSVYNTVPGGYGYKSGTSMAAPHVTGAVALVWDAHPDWTYTQVINDIFSSVDQLPVLAGKMVTGGRLNLAGALGVVYTPPASDTTPPVTSISSPASGTTYTSAQTVTITASASDNVGVAKVEFYDGSTLKTTITTAPYIYSWTFGATNNGTHIWTAKAYDAANNSSSSPAVSLTVNIPTADTTAPTVSIFTPASGTTYTAAQTVTLSATASDNVGVTKVEFYDGTILKGSATVAPYSFNWAFGASANGAHNWTAKAYDAAGNSASSTAITLIVNITTPDTQAPSVVVSCPSTITSSNKTCTASASDNVGVTQVAFYLDGSTKPLVDTLAPYNWTAQTNGNGALTAGSHALVAKAYDAAGNTATATTTFTFGSTTNGGKK